ncbi:MAG: hypothetical protein K2J77_09380 [Oscillospiraceae bacterium]|nr:hypothetical protein [Oscillospiraceae bacterium]
MKKKPVAILALIGGGAVAVAMVAFMAIVVFITLSMFFKQGFEWALYVVTALFVYAMSYLGRHPRAFYKKTHNIGSAAFIALACVPSLIAAVLLYFFHTPEIAEETGTDVMGVRLLFGLAASAAFTLSLIIRAVTDAIKYKIEHKRTKTLSEIEVDAEEEE